MLKCGELRLISKAMWFQLLPRRLKVIVLKILTVINHTGSVSVLILDFGNNLSVSMWKKVWEWFDINTLLGKFKTESP